jgi:glycosyltransferase involved in cell wall biosynthesis
MTNEREPRDRPLRIVMLIPYDLEYQPFTIRSTMFATELVKRGHHVRIFYRAKPDAKRGNRVHHSLPESCDARPLRAFSGRAWRNLADALRAADVIHFQKSLPPTTQIALLMGWLGKPLHQDWDDYEFAFWSQAARDAWRSDATLARRLAATVGAAVKALLTGSMERLIPKAVDTLGGASLFLREKSIEWGADREDVFPAQVGVDCEFFRPERRSEDLRRRLGLSGPTVLFAGTFHVYPDLAFFAESLRVLVREVENVKCLIVGGGPGRERLAGLVGDGLPKGLVVMTDGLVPFDEMPLFVASADVAALPFRKTPVNESKSSLTLLECMASGLAIVSHDVGDSGRMLGDCGVLAPLADPVAFGRALAELARDPEQRERLGRKARARAMERFTWAGSVDHLEAAYYHAIVKKRGKGRSA